MQKHTLPYQHGAEEKIVGPLSMRQSIWILGGGYLIYSFISNEFYLPLLPFPYNMVHLLPIILVSVAGAYLRYKGDYATNYIMRWIDCKTRKRFFTYKKGGGHSD